MNAPKPYFLFTNTPTHVGAGKAVGYVDQPIQREVHTKIPVVPGSSLKGVLRDLFKGDSKVDWLFGVENAEYAGALLIGEARVLAFPVRSAKGCFAWITCPLVLKRAQRDKILQCAVDLEVFKPANSEDEAPDRTVIAGNAVTLPGNKVVLEEYTFDAHPDVSLLSLETTFQTLLGTADPVWQDQLPGRLVVVSNALFSYFVVSACEIAQHVRIEDETGTASDGGLFNEENVPSETLFYGVLSAQKINGKDPDEALETLHDKLAGGTPLQIGGGETTGNGWCTIIFPNN